jgi:hypothetical protein
VARPSARKRPRRMPQERRSTRRDRYHPPLVGSRHVGIDVGLSRPLATNDVLPFIESSDQDAAEIDRPAAVVDFLESDRVVDEPVVNEEDSLLKAERPGVCDASR